MNTTVNTNLHVSFQDAQDSFTDWFDHYHQKRPTAPKKPPQSATFAQQVAYEQAEQQYRGEMERWKQTLNLITTVGKGSRGSFMLKDLKKKGRQVMLG